MATAKDYKGVAEALRLAKLSREATIKAATAIEDYFAKDNPNFKRSRFIESVMLGREQEGEKK